MTFMYICGDEVVIRLSLVDKILFVDLGFMFVYFRKISKETRRGEGVESVDVKIFKKKK
jgi:hypothetical protein